MKILEKCNVDGVDIQLEDWGNFGYGIGAYPIAKHNGKWIRNNETFRLTISRGYSDNNSVINDFNKLKNKLITLVDLAEHFWNGDKDKYYMGMIDTFEGV